MRLRVAAGGGPAALKVLAAAGAAAAPVRLVWGGLPLGETAGPGRDPPPPPSTGSGDPHPSAGGRRA